ncbi:MAG: hypothetical protein WCY46_05745 [Tissierellaceae bacterium]
MKKSMKLISIYIILLFLIGCSKKDSFPAVLSLEDSIKEIIVSKSNTYNFMKDELYLNYMERLGEQLVTNPYTDPPHYSIGNLDDDNIPELVVFKERDPEDIDDKGNLEVYQFDGEKYILLDAVSMNYDNSNYQIAIGKIAKDINGILLNNNIGAHSGMTYGFILEDGKLKNIFDDNKVSLISIYANNEIRDIDEDGILEFSVYTIDPETLDFTVLNSEKMTLWYKWNGKDGADLIKVERGDLSLEASDKTVFQRVEELIKDNLPSALDFFSENKSLLSRFDNVSLLKSYIMMLKDNIDAHTEEISNLFAEYQYEKNYDYLFEKYGLSLDKINSIEYLNREKTLKDVQEIKNNLIECINLGYKLDLSEGMYFYSIDYQKFLDLFSENITNEYRDYIKILALDTNEPFMRDGSLMISTDKLIDRILLAESFKIVYPYSEFLPQVIEIYHRYLQVYFYGDLHLPNYDTNLRIKDEALTEFENTAERYSYTVFGNLVKRFLETLENTNYIVDEDFRKTVKYIFE